MKQPKNPATPKMQLATAQLAVRAARKREPLLAVGWMLVGMFGTVLLESAEVESQTTPPPSPDPAEKDCGWAERVPSKKPRALPR